MFNSFSGKCRFIGLIALIVLIYSGPAMSQENTKSSVGVPTPATADMQMITLTDGTRILGWVLAEDTTTLWIATRFGEISIARSEIELTRTVQTSSFKEGKYWFPNPNATRLYLTPTARMSAEGSWSFSAFYLFFPGIAYAITDNISISGGFSIFPEIATADQLYFVAPKIGAKVAEHLDLAVGAILVRLPGDHDYDDAELAGVVYGLTTIGTLDLSATLGFGYAFADGDWEDKPVMLIGAESRLLPHVSFITENLIFPGFEDPLMSYGFRFFGEEMAVDLAIFRPVGKNSNDPSFPYIDFVINF